MFVPLKCPACGAECEIDEAREFAFCSFCGAKMFNQKQQVEITGAVKVDSAHTIANLLERANRFRAEKNMARAREYYDRVLDMDVDNKAAQRAIDEMDGMVRHNNVFIVGDPVFIPSKKDRINSWVGNLFKKPDDTDFAFYASVDNGVFVHIGLNNIGVGLFGIGTHIIHAVYNGNVMGDFSFSIDDIDQTRIIVISYDRRKLCSRYGNEEDLPDSNAEETVYKLLNGSIVRSQIPSKNVNPMDSLTDDAKKKELSMRDASKKRLKRGLTIAAITILVVSAPLIATSLARTDGHGAEVDAAVITSSIAPASTNTPKPTATSTVYGTIFNVSGASTAFAEMSRSSAERYRVKRGETIIVLSQDGEWYLIEYNGEQAYMQMKYVDADAPAPQSVDGESIDADAPMGEVVEIDTAMVSLLVGKEYTVEQASEIQQILNTLGITSIVIENMTGKASEGLNAVVCYPNGYTDRNRRFYFTTDNGELFYAGFLDEDLYDTARGGYLKSYADVHVPETKIDLDTYSALQMLAEQDVKACLSHPSTADFHYLSWAVGRSDDHYKIIGKVSAKNSFGVEDDMHFSVWYVASGNRFVLEGVEIDGTRVR